jgi:hypothetical protein
MGSSIFLRGLLIFCAIASFAIAFVFFPVVLIELMYRWIYLPPDNWNGAKLFSALVFFVLNCGYLGLSYKMLVYGLDRQEANKFFRTFVRILIEWLYIIFLFPKLASYYIQVTNGINGLVIQINSIPHLAYSIVVVAIVVWNCYNDFKSMMVASG